ncbi:MAG: NERD domain-containing protein [Chloroflexi bacterium]|nr:NERD domain-containing protein [Chloroflexota bacterium]
MLRFKAEPESIRAWGIGSAGEEQLGAALAEVPDLWTLNDRRVKGSKANIDHILVAPAGVFVVDAKAYSGLVQVRNVGGLFRTELRLYVGGRDRSKLADGLVWQVSAVRAALGSVDLPIVPRIAPVLCFIGSQWPRFRPPNEFEGVRLEDPGSLRGLLREPVELGPAEIEQIARHFAAELPPR